MVFGDEEHFNWKCLGQTRVLNTQSYVIGCQHRLSTDRQTMHNTALNFHK